MEHVQREPLNEGIYKELIIPKTPVQKHQRDDKNSHDPRENNPMPPQKMHA
jgi:hypothetical protein